MYTGVMFVHVLLLILYALLFMVFAVARLFIIMLSFFLLVNFVWLYFVSSSILLLTSL